MEVNDKVRHKDIPNSAICDVIEVKDLGHGQGNERVRICLMGIFTRYYAAKELVVVEKGVA